LTKLLQIVKVLYYIWQQSKEVQVGFQMRRLQIPHQSRTQPQLLLE
jgi:hypothetical protein